MNLKIACYELHKYKDEFGQHFHLDNVRIKNENWQAENSEEVRYAKRIKGEIVNEKNATVFLRPTTNGSLRHEFHKFPVLKPKPTQIKKVELEDHVYRAVYNALKSYHSRRQYTGQNAVVFSEYGMEYIPSPIHVAILCLKGILRSLYELNQVPENSQYLLNMVDRNRVKDARHILALCADRIGLKVCNNKQAVHLRSLEDIRLLHDALHENGLSKRRLLRGRCPLVIYSPSTSDFFPLHNLPKTCFLAVAEHLNNRERRILAHKCQRFRQLLIPKDRYSTLPESYWDESTLPEDLSMRLKRPVVPQHLETRRPLRSVYIREKTRYEFCINLLETRDFMTNSEDNKYAAMRGGINDDNTFERIIGVHSLCSIDSEDKSPSNLDDVWSFAIPMPKGTFEHDYTIFGKLPTIVHQTIHEINKHFVYGKIILTIDSIEREQMYRMLTARHDCGKANVDLVFENRELSETSLRSILTHFRDEMPASCRLFLCPIDRLQFLYLLKSIWDERGTVVKWRACPEEELDWPEVIQVNKTTIENTVFVAYDDDIQFQAPGN